MSIINNQSFGPAQQEDLNVALGAFVMSLVNAAPQLGAHLLSGGFVEIKTMSGAHLKFGFGPRPGGLILPGGIRPAGQNGGLIK